MGDIDDDPTTKCVWLQFGDGSTAVDYFVLENTTFGINGILEPIRRILGERPGYHERPLGGEGWGML